MIFVPIFYKSSIIFSYFLFEENMIMQVLSILFYISHKNSIPVSLECYVWSWRFFVTIFQFIIIIETLTKVLKRKFVSYGVAVKLLCYLVYLWAYFMIILLLIRDIVSMCRLLGSEIFCHPSPSHTITDLLLFLSDVLAK